jgi:hypothetical protein
MNDMSVLELERRRARVAELREHRDLRAGADDAVDRQLMRALIRAHAALERFVVTRGRAPIPGGLAVERGKRAPQPAHALVVGARRERVFRCVAGPPEH